MYRKLFDLHQITDSDDLNFDYQKFLSKLSQIALKIFLPFLSLIYLITLFFCRIFLSNEIFDLRTILSLIFFLFSFVLILLIRSHKKYRNLWIFTRFAILILLIVPLILTYQTEQFHILFSTITILLIYSFFTFTLLQSLLISLSISIIHLILLRYSHDTNWNNLQLFIVIIHHLIIHFTGLFSSIDSIRHIRKHFYTYQTNLYEKNKANVDCKKLHTILRYCHGIKISLNFSSKPGTIIYCSISLNEQTHIHTSEEFASFIDVLFCQLEQLILRIHPSAEYLFDNETILINLSNNEHVGILAIEIFRFIHYVNQQTQWNLNYLIAIDINPFSLDFIRWLRDECLIKDRIYLSSKIFPIFQNNPNYQLTLINSNFMYYSLYNENMFETFTNHFIPSITSDMIDQLTRIEAEYHVEKHLGTITLTHSMEKRSLFELTSKYLNWFTLKFQENFLHQDFQTIHRTDHPSRILYILIFLILIGAFFQGHVFYSSSYILILFCLPLIILVLIFFFYYYIRQEQSSRRKTFYIYFNLLICLTLTTSLFLAIQYHSIQNFKSLIIVNYTTIYRESFHHHYHEYLIICPIYPLYFCTLFRQCSWMIKTLLIIICSILQIYVYEYIWLTTKSYFPMISSFHHYTALTLILFHNLLLIFICYVHEWLEKIDFLWLKQLDHERLMIIRQRNQLIKQISFLYPLRMINFYLTTSINSSFIQHYHKKYEQMGLLYIRLDNSIDENSSSLMELINTIDYLLKRNERYSKIVLHRKSTIKEFIFSIDLTSSLKSIEDLIELLFQIFEYIQTYQISFMSCIHIGTITEILIHLKNSPKLDIWSEHITFMEYLLTKIQINHCLITSSVYHLMNNFYLFRTAGTIIKTRMNIENNNNIYYLLGRLIGENIFQGRNTLPLTINQSIRNSLSTDESVYSSKILQNKTHSLLTTTSSALIEYSSQHTPLKILNPPILSSSIKHNEKLSTININEETTSSFSGWDENDKIINSNNPSFTVNMTTNTNQEQQSSIRMNKFNLARKLIADTSESEISIHQQPWTRNVVYQHRPYRRSSSYNNLSKVHSKEIYQIDFLQRWLEDQLNQFCTQIKQTPPIIKRKFQRFSTIDNDSTDEEFDTIHEKTYPMINEKKFFKRSSHLIRHQSLKNQNQPLLFENKSSRRTDSTSMPRSEISSDRQSSRPENLSESVLSNVGSEYDNMSAQNSNINNYSHQTNDDDDDDDDEPTLTNTTNRCYF